MRQPREIVTEVVILNSLGLHARPAAMLVEAVSNLSCEVSITKDDLTVDAKSLMGVLTLAAEQGAILHLCARGSDRQLALDRITQLVESKFGEE
jgi:phosphocarrier protein